MSAAEDGEKGAVAAAKRKVMLADLRRVVRLCTCEWPLTVYRNGDGHHSECPAHRSIGELIERSSLGTPGAKALRRRTPPEVVDRIMAKVAERDRAIADELTREAEDLGLYEPPTSARGGESDG